MPNNTKYIYHLFLFFLLGFQFSYVQAHQQHVNFTENKGQWFNQVNFKANLDGGALFIENNCFTYHFYNKAALQKNAFAAYEIATLLYRGKGADRDPVMAVVMAHLAEVNGWKDASEFKEKVEAGLSHEQREHAETLFAQCIKSDYQYCQ